jgi:photosystem II stability/assembly factor-like uncharacterized protein
VWRTTDRGTTWTPVPVEGHWGVHDIVFSPDGEVALVSLFGIWRRTRDEGKWEHVWEPSRRWEPESVLGFFFYERPGSEDGERVIAALGEGFLLESADDGATWQQVAEPDVFANIRYRPTQVFQGAVGGRELWLAKAGGRAIMASADHGRSWEPLELPFDNSPELWDVDAGGSLCAVAQDLRGGELFTSTQDPRRATSVVAQRQEPRIAAIVCDPHDAKTIYLARSDGSVLRSIDHGTTFHVIDGGPRGIDINGLAISLHDGALWVATAGNGVWILDKPKEQPAVPLSD